MNELLNIADLLAQLFHIVVELTCLYFLTQSIEVKSPFIFEPIAANADFLIDDSHSVYSIFVYNGINCYRVT